MIRVLIVDDSAFVRRAVERMLHGAPEVEIAGLASNGREALEQVRRLKPDVVIMDVNMPEMDGLEALRRIMEEAPVPVLLLSTLTKAGADVTIEGLELGAVDFLDKGSVGTSMDIYDLAPQLREKVRGIAGIESPAAPGSPPVPPPAVDRYARAAQGVGGAGIHATSAYPYQIVAVGASTGGPRALAVLLPALPADFPAGVLVAQHMPAGFTATLADRLNRRCVLRVKEAENGDVVAPGTVLIAPGRTQMSLTRKGEEVVVRISRGTDESLHQPSVDVLFDSVAEVVGASAVGVVLTGMGTDGSQGMATLQRAGAQTIAEHRSTAVISGMPAAAAPYAREVLPLERIAPRLLYLCGQRATTKDFDS